MDRKSRKIESFIIIAALLVGASAWVAWSTEPTLDEVIVGTWALKSEDEWFVQRFGDHSPKLEFRENGEYTDSFLPSGEGRVRSSNSRYQATRDQLSFLYPDGNGGSVGKTWRATSVSKNRLELLDEASGDRLVMRRVN